uniref:Uncharacterized protein n=1 Tax=Leptobrachium leishanense TaxID=445787 RepID=A0A8C5QNB9_9ANUR
MKRFRRFLLRVRAFCCCCLRPRCLCAANDDTISQSSVEDYQLSGAVLPDLPQDDTDVALVSSESQLKFEAEAPAEPSGASSKEDLANPSEGMKTVEDLKVPVEPEVNLENEALPIPLEDASLSDIPEPEQEELHVNVSTQLDVKTEMETLLDTPEVVSLCDFSVPVQEQHLPTEPEEILEVEALPNPTEVSSLGVLPEPHKDIIQEEPAQDPEPYLEKPAEQDLIASDEVDIILPVSVDERIHRPFPVGLQDFRSCAVLGIGGFGTVLLVEFKERNNFFAIKAIKKAVMIQRNFVARLTYEQQIFQTVSSARHPFLVNLFASFHDDHYIYFVMEYAAGGDLLSNQDNIGGPFPQERAVFYAACIVLALDFLHKNKIVHRDLKLENVVLDKDGFAKLTDFGLSKAGIGFGDRTETRLGTIVYMAPEMVTGQAYTRDADWWSLGVLIYAMLHLEMPFGDGEDEYETMNRIVNGEVEYPTHWSPETISLISQLLIKDPTQRLGSSEEGAKDVMAHPFFKDIDWSKLLQKELRPPFLPPLSGPEDVSNFDQVFTSMDPVLPSPEGPELTEEEQEVFNVFDWEAEWAP